MDAFQEQQAFFAKANLYLPREEVWAQLPQDVKDLITAEQQRATNEWVANFIVCP